jgi:YbbR domain-containing protein
MTTNPLSFLVKNINSIILALALAISVWVSAVIASDPNEEKDLDYHPVLELVGLGDGLVQTEAIPTDVEVRLRAPKSVWEDIDQDPEAVNAFVDLTDLEEGQYELPIQVTFDTTPVQLVELHPVKVTIKLEPLISQVVSIRPLLQGEPALGFHANEPVLSEGLVQVSGPQSSIQQMDEIRAELSITGARESITSEVALTPVDIDGEQIQGLILSPNQVKMTVEIIQSGGYRDVAVKVETVGQPVSGYRVTNISVSPPTVTLFSSDPQLVAEMPGYVSTQPLNLREIDDDKEVRITLALPEGVTIVGGEQSVQVQIGIAAVETSISLTIPISILGLGTDLQAVVSPETIDIFLTGPLPILDDLTSESVLAFVDLTDLGPGSHLVEPQVEILPERVVQEAINPDTIQVTITEIGTP